MSGRFVGWRRPPDQHACEVAQRNESRHSEAVEQNPRQPSGHFIRALGRFFMVIGALQVVVGLVALVAGLVTGSAEGIGIGVGSVGSGVASSLIGYGLRRLF
jgi:hypothetical protein